jgi:hypothetical protein
VKENHGSKHTEYIAEADHGISHAEGEILYDIHPEYGTGSKKQTTCGKMPVRQEATPKLLVPSKWQHAHECIFEEHLSAHEE